MAEKNVKKLPGKAGRSIPVPSKIPTSGHDSGTHSTSSSVSNLTAASDLHLDVGNAMSEHNHNFKVDERVWVNGSKPGCIKFIGNTEFAPGSWAGVVLDEAVGKNDGSVAGVKYFSCEPMKGIFARPSKLSRTCSPNESSGDALRTPRGSVAVSTGTPSLKGVPLSTPTGSRTCSRLRIGERVVVSSTTGNKGGVLKFLGETEFAKGDWAGIALDEPVGKNDGSVAGKRYFQCPLKYGLFAPLHKISRAGGTGTPGSRAGSRSGSVRDIPMRRSVSRESLSSSVSNSSKTSRVKLGVTSLASSQKRNTGIGIMTTSRALEEVIKEKDQHIEQLLKEHDLERSEVAAMTSCYEEMQKRIFDLQNMQQKADDWRKNVEQELSMDKKKLEDLQFQLEEESILKSDLELQLQQQNILIKRLEEFLNEKDSRFLNVKEILEGKETLSDIPDNEVQNVEADMLKKKITDLENKFKNTTEESIQALESSEKLKSSIIAIEAKNAEFVLSLKNTIQEKDDVNSNLRNELSSQLEKLSKVMEENTSLNETLNLQATEAKGQADSVVKEFGEKMKLYEDLSEELKSKCSLLDISMQEKDSQIDLLNKNLEIQASELDKIKDANNNLNHSLEQRALELAHKITLHKALEDELAVLKTKLQSEIPEKEEKILGLVQKIEGLTCSLQEKEDELALKENQIAKLDNRTGELTNTITDITSKLQQAQESMSCSDRDNSEKTDGLEQKIIKIKAESDLVKSNLEKEMSNLQDKCNSLSAELESKVTALSEKESSFSVLNESLSEKETESSNIQSELAAVKQTLQELQKEKDEASKLLKEKELLISDFGKQLEDSKNIVEQQKIKIQENEKEKESLEITNKAKNEENVNLNSSLKIAQENVEMLNKNTNEQVSSLRNELAKVTEDSTRTKADMEKAIASLEKQLEDSKNSVIERKAQILENKKERDSLTTIIQQKEEIIVQYTSKLLLAEQSVEMLNKDSSEHVMSLQKELSKANLEWAQVKASLEKVITDLQSQVEESKKVINENNSVLSQSMKDRDSLEEIIKQKNEENCQLSSKLELAQKDSEVLNKTSNEQLLSLQNELSNLTEEKIKSEDSLRQEILAIQTEKQRLLQLVDEKNLSLDQTNKELSNSQHQVKNHETKASDLSNQLEKVKQEVVAITKDKEEVLSTLQTKLSTDKELFESELKRKDQVIKETHGKLSDISVQLEERVKESVQKENEMVLLKKAIQDKELKYGELSVVVNSLESDLNNLKQQNESNKNLLQSKESSFNELKTTKEKILLEKEECFAKKFSDLTTVLSNKDKEAKEKENIILKLTSQTEEQEKQLSALNLKLKETQSLHEKSLLSSDSSHKELLEKCTTLEKQMESLLKEKEKIAEEGKKARDMTKSLEKTHASLLQEKLQQEQVIGDREAKLVALQAEVGRMQSEFVSHKQQLDQKLDVSKAELQAALELKKELDTQHSVLEELQQQLHNSEEKCKSFEGELQSKSAIILEKSQLLKQMDEFEKGNKEKNKKLQEMEKNNQELQDLLSNDEIVISNQEKEVLSLKEKIEILLMNDESIEKVKVSLKSMAEENKLLKQKLGVLSAQAQNVTHNANEAANNNTNITEDDKEFLTNQVDFLNSIIVDLKQKNGELTQQLELQIYDPNEIDPNENTPKKIAPRLFCDICDMFDLHDTEDCPKQESYIGEEEIPHLIPQGVRQFEERPYCNNCEVFGHWTLECKEEETY